MLHGLLLVLKWGGILLLFLIFLMFLAAALILLVPVRYRGRGSFHGKPEGELGVTWFWRAFSIRAVCRDGISFDVRLFGFPLFRDGPEEEDEWEEEWEADGAGARREEKADGREEEKADRTGKTGSESAGNREPVLTTQELSGGRGTALDESFGEAGGRGTASDGTAGKTGGRLRGGRLRRRLRDALQRPQDALRSLLFRGGRLLRRLAAAAGGAAGKYGQIRSFLEKEENRRSFSLLKRQAGKLLRHLAPRRLSGTLSFGVEDPYRMGQLTALAAFLYPFYGSTLEVNPVFDRSFLEGEISLRGRIRAGTLLWIGLRLLADRNLRSWIRKLRNRGGI